MNQNIEAKRSFMNTTITIRVLSEEKHTDSVKKSIDKAFGEFDRIVEKFTRFEETSELSELNSNSGRWYKVSEEFFYLIKYMHTLSIKTKATFDPTVIDLLEAYGYSRNYDFKDKLNDPELNSNIDEIMRTRRTALDIQLDETNLKVKLAPNQRIDLGSIGKGYAIDCAYYQLDHYESLLIDAGGDIRCKGKNIQNSDWQIGLKHNIDGEEGYIGSLSLSNMSLCCSGSWARKVGKFHHLINSSTGKPENSTATVYTVSESAMVADAWSTILFLMGEDGFELMPEGTSALVIKSDNTIKKTANFPKIQDIK